MSAPASLLVLASAIRDVKCAFDGCAGDAIAKGYCHGHYRRHRLGLEMKPLMEMAWSDGEIELMKRHYATGLPSGLDALAKKLGRLKSNVSRKARSLGLTEPARPKKRQPSLSLFDPPPLSPEERRERASRATRERIATQGHPRGMLGRTHSAEAKAAIGLASIEKWRDPDSKINSPESKQKRSDNLVALLASGQMRANRYSRGKGGRRADLGDVYFRSRWEANYARFLNWCVKQGTVTRWEFEPKTFVFEKISRGTRAYTPDFKVYLPDGSYEWREIKGWMDPKSKTRLDRMARYFPDEPVVVVTGSFFSSARRTGLAAILPGWEKTK